jgi:hypothetical protein
VVTNTTVVASATAGSTSRNASATSAMVVGQTSGQWVKPKKSSVGPAAVRAAKSYGAPVESVSVNDGFWYGSRR